MKKKQICEGSLTAMGQRFVDAWHRAAQGEPVDETHVTFLDLEATRLRQFNAGEGPYGQWNQQLESRILRNL